jgi:L-rhamnose mutarotase
MMIAPTWLIRGAAAAAVLGTAVLAAAVPQKTAAKVQRYGSVIGLRPEKIPYYKKLHKAAWPGVLKMIKQCNIRNYSIYLKEVEPGKFYLFSYFEYTGKNYDADMAKMAADATTQEWWKECNPCQFPIPTARPGDWWSGMEEVFHND